VKALRLLLEHETSSKDRLKQDHERFTSEIAKLKRDNTKLTSEIEKLKSEAQTTPQIPTQAILGTDLVQTPSTQAMAEQKKDTTAEATIAELKRQLEDEIATRKRVQEERDSIFSELEDLSQSLFEESNKYLIRMRVILKLSQACERRGEESSCDWPG
jgi:septation ring formation regulator EzrA